MNKFFSIVIGSLLLLGAGACGSADDVELQSVTSEVEEVAEHARDHRPYCGAVGTKSEGWYWGDSGELIQYESCETLKMLPECKNVGSRSEGWMIGDKLLVWDQCRHTVGLAAAGEACGEKAGTTCFDGLYCRGEDTEAGGTCLPHGWCDAKVDCMAADNVWLHTACAGQGDCQHNKCVWQCDADPVKENWGWLTVAVDGFESQHPYSPDEVSLWEVKVEGANGIQLHFDHVDTEFLVDFVVVFGLEDYNLLIADGTLHDYWTPMMDGDSVIVGLFSDFSDQGWGFQIDQVSYYSKLPQGTCTVDEHCNAGKTCRAIDGCQDPTVPCLGRCEVPSLD